MPTALVSLGGKNGKRIGVMAIVGKGRARKEGEGRPASIAQHQDQLNYGKKERGRTNELFGGEDKFHQRGRGGTRVESSRDSPRYGVIAQS